MIRTITYEDIISQFTDSVSGILDDLVQKNKELKKAKETERTREYYAEKLIKQWFRNNGGL